MTRRLALLIGNSKYDDPEFTPLKKPLQDVDMLAEILQDPNMGHFDEVESLNNQPYNILREKIYDFFIGKQPDDLLLFYFSGHGVEEDRKLFLTVKDTNKLKVIPTAISARFVREACKKSGSKQQVIILDCCYSGLFGGKGGSNQNLAEFASKARGQVVLAATSRSQEAMEDNKKLGPIPTSVFTHFLLEGIKTGAADTNEDGHIGINELFSYVENKMAEVFMGKQTPHKHELSPSTQEIIIAHNPVRPNHRAVLSKQLRRRLDAPDFNTQREVLIELTDLIDYPSSLDVQEAARLELVRFSRHSKDERIRLRAMAALAEEKANDLASKLLPATPKTKIAFDWVTIPAGEFIMGSNDYDDEMPIHKVYLPEYQITRVPVTNEQWGIFLQDTHYEWENQDKLWKNGLPRGKEKHPVVCVTWHDVMAFCQWAAVRLPTEAEWEKAARGTDERKWPWGNNEPTANLCNFNANIGDTTPVDNYPAGKSPFECLDMAGNVWEWCSSAYQPYSDIVNDRRKDVNIIDNLKVLRGGGCSTYSSFTRVTSRYKYETTVWNRNIGCRCVC